MHYTDKRSTQHPILNRCFWRTELNLSLIWMNSHFSRPKDSIWQQKHHHNHTRRIQQQRSKRKMAKEWRIIGYKHKALYIRIRVISTSLHLGNMCFLYIFAIYIYICITYTIKDVPFSSSTQKYWPSAQLYAARVGLQHTVYTASSSYSIFLRRWKKYDKSDDNDAAWTTPRHKSTTAHHARCTNNQNSCILL